MAQRAFVFLAAIFLLSAATVRADLIIDQFNTPDDQSLKVTTKNPVDTNVTQASSAIGGWRDISLHEVAGQPMYVDVFSDPGSGLYFTEGTGQAYTIVTWAGADTSSKPQYDLNANLTSGGDDRFLLNVIGVTGTGIDVTMTVYSNGGTNSSTTTTPVTVTSTGEIPLLFSSFSGNANLTDVNAIVLELSGVGHAGSDIALSSLTTAAPEPSTLVLAAMGVVALLGVGRKWRKA
jgi:hypothetical protein